MQEASMQSDFVIGVLSGVLTLASLALAILGVVFSYFAQIMATVGVEQPPRMAYLLKQIAIWTLVLTVVSSFVAILCIVWIYVQGEGLFFFISLSLVAVLIILCSVVCYIVMSMMKLE
jgi:hypothetical protein